LDAKADCDQFNLEHVARKISKI